MANWNDDTPHLIHVMMRAMLVSKMSIRAYSVHNVTTHFEE